MSQQTRRWEGGVVATVVLAVLGLISRDGTLLLAAAIPLTYVAYGTLSSVTVLAELSAERTVEPTTAPPGRPVEVALTLTNDSNQTLSDLRVVDRVPSELAVSKGTPRAGTVLEPGESETIRYEVIPRRGEFQFESPRVRIRDSGAGAIDTDTVSTTGDDRLVCRLDAEAPPIYEEGSGYVGRLTANDPGRGVEFHSTRAYRRGDPAARIDWRGYAKRGTLRTVNYARQVSATVVAVVDARPISHVVAGPGRPTAVELSAYAAIQAISDLLRANNDVGIAVLGMSGPGPANLHWIPPGTGQQQRARALDVFNTAIDEGRAAVTGGTDDFADQILTDTPSLASGSAIDRQVERLVGLAPPGSQFVLFSPVLDDAAVDAVETWTAFGVPVSLLSPDVIPANTVGGQLDAVDRQTRLARCQATGARTVDWRRGTPLPIVLERAFAANARLSPRVGADAASGGGR